MDAGRAEPEVSRRVLDCTLEITLETGEDYLVSSAHGTAPIATRTGAVVLYIFGQKIGVVLYISRRVHVSHIEPEHIVHLSVLRARAAHGRARGRRSHRAAPRSAIGNGMRVRNAHLVVVGGEVFVLVPGRARHCWNINI